MAGELQCSYQANKTVYFLIRSRISQIWSTSGGTGAFAGYLTPSYADYDIAGTQQGTASAFYVADFPTNIVPGIYSIVAKEQIGASPAETDPTISVGDYQWNGAATLPLSDLATSGQIGQVGTGIQIPRGTMVRNLPLYLKSSADHVTPFTSGVISGQIARDNGTFGPLQSGAFTETGLGFYNLQALTSGDLNANTVKLLFTAAGISGGNADPLPMALVLQRTSGS